MWLISTRLRRLNQADSRAFAAATASAESARAGGLRPGERLFSPRGIALALWPQLLSSLRFLLPTSIFALKFLEWWHNSDFAKQLSRKANEGLELPPPVIAKQVNYNPDQQRKDASVDATIPSPPISAITHLPILTVPAPVYSSTEQENNTALCPICQSPIQTPTAAQTGCVYCYSCIYKWVDGTHPRQEAFMDGGMDEEIAAGWAEEGEGSRSGKWESGIGRDAVTGRRVLGGTSGLRRVMV